MTAPDPDALEALRALVHQIQLSEFKDELGHRLKMNQAFLDAAAVVELSAPKRED